MEVFGENNSSQTLPLRNMSNQEHESYASSIEQLQQDQKVLARYITGLKCRLDDRSKQFNNCPEIKQFRSLQDALAQLDQLAQAIAFTRTTS